MSQTDTLSTGGCVCGAVRFTLRGEAKRAGLCHCMTCRKAHSAAYNPFVVFEAEQLDVSGPLKAWESSPGYTRWFCAECGSRIYGGNGGEVEVSIGSFDRPGEFTPQYESWTIRREPWLAPLDAPQFEEDRVP